MIVTRSLHSAIDEILVQLIRSPKTGRDTRIRAEICFYAFHCPELFSPQTLGELVGVSAKTVRKHVARFEQSIDALEACVAEGNASRLERTVIDCLRDAPRSGRSPDFSPMQIVAIVSIACEKPENSRRPISKWTSREIVDEAVKRQIVTRISVSHVGRILRSVNMQPHKTKGWCFTTEKDREAFARQVQEVCDTYIQQTRNNDVIEGLLKHDREGKWEIIADNLNTHCSEALVRLIARLEGIDEVTLGDKKKRRGILGSMKSRKKFLSDPSHRIRFVYLPKHSSWLNQIEVIFGIIRRRGLSGGSFKSQSALIERLTAFIDYFNRTFARPMNWTYTGRPTEDEAMQKPLTWRERLQPKSFQDHWNEFTEMLAA